MSLNWYQRRHCFPCPDCGAYIEEGDYNCDSEECEMDRKREQRDYERRGIIHRYRQEFRHRRSPANVYIAGPAGVLYRAKRYVGGVVRFSVIVDDSLSYHVEWYRVPNTVRHAAHTYFNV